MSVQAIKKEEYQLYKNKFLAWARRQWPVFSETDYEDIYHEALMKYLINAREGKIRPEIDPLMVIRGFGQDNFRKRWRVLRKSWQKIIPLDRLSTSDDEEGANPEEEAIFPQNQLPFSQHPTRSPEEVEYHSSRCKAKEAFEMLTEEEKDLLSAKVIHNIAWKDYADEHSDEPDADQAAKRRYHQRLRKRKESVVKKLRANYYKLLRTGSEPAPVNRKMKKE